MTDDTNPQGQAAATDAADTTPGDVPLRGAIEGVAVLDLTSVRDAEELARITSIRGVALVLVPRSLAGVLANVPMSGVANVVPVPDGTAVHLHTGSLVLGGDALAGPSDQEAVLVVTGVLAISSPVEHVGYREVVVTGLVLAPEGSEAALGAGLTRLTGSVEYFRYQAGQRIRIVSGQNRLRGSALVNAGGDPADVLVLTGQTIVSTEVASLGYQRVVAAGQVLLPAASEEVLAPALSAQGQVVWYEGEPRFFIGEDRFDLGFFELVDQPLTLVLVGSFELGPDVTSDALRAAVDEITLIGELRAPRHLVPVLQLLTVDRQGSIEVVEPADAAEPSASEAAGARARADGHGVPTDG